LFSLSRLANRDAYDVIKNRGAKGLFVKLGFVAADVGAALVYDLVSIRGYDALMTSTARSNKSLDASGGSVFRN
jgi:hypothetical protein